MKKTIKKTIKNLCLVLTIAFLMCGASAYADMQYPSDPVYQSLDPADPSPMQDMIDLAKGGDARAQYILGDLYSKGKGGLPKDSKKSADWFETAAKNGYFESFIRLAALARHQGKPVEAYKWYTLGTYYLDSREWRQHADKARDVIEKETPLKSEDIDSARKEANVWRSTQRREAEENRKKADQAKKNTPTLKSEKQKP
jgi:TPR repeat protein